MRRVSGVPCRKGSEFDSSKVKTKHSVFKLSFVDKFLVYLALSPYVIDKEHRKKDEGDRKERSESKSMKNCP